MVSRLLKNYLKGFCIGAADVVPGISGGTVAFIIGIYEQFLLSIASFNRKNLSLFFRGKFAEFSRNVSLPFLLSVLAGVATAFILLAKTVTLLLNDPVYRVYLYALFMGLVLGSCYFCVRQLQLFRKRFMVPLLAGCAIAFLLSSPSAASLVKADMRQSLYTVPLVDVEKAQEKRDELLSRKPQNLDPATFHLLNVTPADMKALIAQEIVSLDSLVTNQHSLQVQSVRELQQGTRSTSLLDAFFDTWVIVCGMIAVSAMLLPGISGSYMLTILGMYGTILASLVDFVAGISAGKFDIAAFRIVFSMILGICVGAVFFSKVVSYLLQQFREVTLSMLIGFMVGALPTVWPFWSYVYELDVKHLFDGVRLVPVAPIMPSLTDPTTGIALLFLIAGFGAVFGVEALARKRRNTLCEG